MVWETHRNSLSSSVFSGVDLRSGDIAQGYAWPKGEDGTLREATPFLWRSAELARQLDGDSVSCPLSTAERLDRCKGILSRRPEVYAGLGLRYASPLALSASITGSNDREEGESSGELHFSIGRHFKGP